MTTHTQSTPGALAEACGRAQSRAQRWLVYVTPFNWLTLVTPAVLAALAGAAMLTDTTDDSLRELAGYAALASALLTAIHKALDCDTHQEKCRQLIGDFAGLRARYDTLGSRNDGQRDQIRDSLDEQFADACGRAARLIPHWPARLISG